MIDTGEGLRRAKEIYANRSHRVKELKAEGKTIIGYPCIYVPVELITALDLISYRTYGDMTEPVTEADRALPTAFCPIMRSCLDCALKARDDFLDGIVAIHSCDPQEKTARVWESYINYSYFHFIDMPGTLRPEALEYFKGQISDFKKTLESFAGDRLSSEKIRAAIALHNRQRALVRELYELTKPEPPLISGTEIVQVIKALMSLPVAEGNELLAQVIREVKERTNGPQKKPARLLVWSSTLDALDIMNIFEAGAHVVLDESCGGIRAYRADVELTDDPLDGLTQYYIEKITCARTFRETVLGEVRKDYMADLERRFGYLKDMAKEWNADGAIFLLVRYCDPFAFEMPSIKDYFDSLDIPSTYIEYDYIQGSLAPLRTRVEAFLETIG
jgi:benzoyl-CoA reductase subunit C